MKRWVVGQNPWNYVGWGNYSPGWQRAVDHCRAADIWLDFADVGVLLTRERAIELNDLAGRINRFWNLDV